MKTIIALALLALANLSLASESCTYAIKDRYGFEFETLTRYSYDRQAACADADFACSQAIAEGQRYGRYYDAFCEQKYDTPNRPPLPPPGRDLICTTDLVDNYGTIIRSFSGRGRTEYEACAQSEEFCRYELSRHDSYGRRCLTRPMNDRPGPGPLPPRTKTESCTATRFDPQGITIENYFASHTGPMNSDVRGEACRKALNHCSQELRGRQFCNVR